MYNKVVVSVRTIEDDALLCCVPVCCGSSSTLNLVKVARLYILYMRPYTRHDRPTEKRMGSNQRTTTPHDVVALTIRPPSDQIDDIVRSCRRVSLAQK